MSTRLHTLCILFECNYYIAGIPWSVSIYIVSGFAALLLTSVAINILAMICCVYRLRRSGGGKRVNVNPLYETGGCVSSEGGRGNVEISYGPGPGCDSGGSVRVNVKTLFDSGGSWKGKMEDPVCDSGESWMGKMEALYDPVCDSGEGGRGNVEPPECDSGGGRGNVEPPGCDSGGGGRGNVEPSGWDSGEGVKDNVEPLYEEVELSEEVEQNEA